MNESIDAVITWVDGYDSIHLTRRNHLLTEIEKDSPPSGINPTRFNQCGEINYCLRSLLAFAPWIRKIFVVTDSQIPPILETIKNSSFSNKVELIDHREIFRDFEDFLPVFNSLSIETVLWRIKDLSPRFIYFNDDCFLLRPVSKDDFFKNSHVVLRGDWKVQHDRKWLSKLFGQTKMIDEHRAAQEKSAQLAGYNKKFFHLPHIPFPLLARDFQSFFHSQPEVFQNNLRFPFRHPEQFWPVSYAHHKLIKEKKACFDNRLKSIMVNAEIHSSKKIAKTMAAADKDTNIAFACMQSMDCANKEKQKLLFSWLDKRIPNL